MSAAWEEVQGLLAEKHQQYSGVANMWAQYNEAKQGVMRVMEDVTPVVDQDMTFSSQGDVKKSLDQHKVSFISTTWYTFSFTLRLLSLYMID